MLKHASTRAIARSLAVSSRISVLKAAPAWKAFAKAWNVWLGKRQHVSELPQKLTSAPKLCNYIYIRDHTAAVFCSKKQRLAVMEFSQDEVLFRFDHGPCYELSTPRCCVYSLFHLLYISLYAMYIYICTVQISLNSVGPESHKPRPYEAKKISCFLDWSVPTDRIRLGGSRHRSCTFIEALKFLSHVFFEASSFQRWLRNSISMHKSRKPSGRLNEAKTQGHYNKLLLRVSESVHDLASQQQLRFATSEETCGSCGMHPIKNVFI